MLNTCLIPSPCPGPVGFYFQNLVRERMPEVHYRTALLEVMLAQAAILNERPPLHSFQEGVL